MVPGHKMKARQVEQNRKLRNKPVDTGCGCYPTSLSRIDTHLAKDERVGKVSMNQNPLSKKFNNIMHTKKMLTCAKSKGKWQTEGKLVIYITDKGIISLIYEEFYKLKARK